MTEMPKSIIRSREKLNESVVHWKFLDDCFPGKVRPTDIDGMIERNNHFLMLEQKSDEKEFIPDGQHILYRNFSTKKNCKVIVFWGKMKDNIPVEISQIIIYEDGNQDWDSEPPSMLRFKKLIQDWWREANG